jgi:hypothetical protein
MSTVDPTIRMYDHLAKGIVGAWLTGGLALGISVSSCSAEWLAENGGTVEAVDAAACSAATAIPVVGSVIALACAGEEAALKSAVDAAIAKQRAADAGTGTAAVALVVGGKLAPVVRRHRSGKGRVHVGYVPAGLAYDVQAALYLAAPVGIDGGPACLGCAPIVGAATDAGAEGGR